jgi:hypothetical protein
MPAMPLALEVGGLLDHLERLLDEPENRRRLYEALAAGRELHDTGLLTDAENAHLRDHFKPPPGWMMHWEGDYEAITRETVLRALEVAGGLSRSAATASGVSFPAHFPIDFLITCGAEQYQGFVSWRTSLTGRRVTVVFSLPPYMAPGEPMWTGVTADNSAVRPPDAAADIAHDSGVWAIGHRDGTRGTSGDATFRSTGLIDVARVSVLDGGRLPDVPAAASE